MILRIEKLGHDFEITEAGLDGENTEARTRY
jgi:hypothetical protein